MFETEYDEEIHKKLKNLRRSRGISVHQLAEEIGENYQKVSRIERGKTNLSIDYLTKVAKALEIPLSKVIKEQPSPPTDSSILNQILVKMDSPEMRHIPTEKRATLITKMYESALKCPHNFLDSFLQQMFEIIALLTRHSNR